MRLLFVLLILCPLPAWAEDRPNFVLVMADDQGWGETSYNGHPLLKTPQLDAMAGNGLRFNRFYAGAPVCSPTRAAVLTGRASCRTGVPEHGYALRHQEITLPALLRQAGYQTAHFGKWHLNGLRGPGVPILQSDRFHPGIFGFDHWLSVTNFYDRDPLLSRMGTFEPRQGDSSETIVEAALEHIAEQAENDEPFLTVIWYGTPHSPFKASDKDCRPFAHLDESSMHHYGELAALDRSIGALRRGLCKLGIEKRTLLWYCSDNGGLPKIDPPTTGNLRGNKGMIYEGGLRVPGIIEWPDTIAPRRTQYPACVMDIMPTLLELAGVNYPSATRPRDGVSLVRIFDQDPSTPRQEPLAFRYRDKAAIVDGDWKLLTNTFPKQWELYDLRTDPTETSNVANQNPDVFERLRDRLTRWHKSVDESIEGKDYPEGTVEPNHPQPVHWVETERYEPYLEEWQQRWEYGNWIKRRRKQNGKKKR
ncbi:MAG: sulfatase-like hydrolase/transferase [Planctomycetota bacterium]